jgi:putative peptide zinc metalloprotease protein
VAPAGLGAGLVSSHWYRVAALKPRLKATLKLHPQRWRGIGWTVIEDRINGRYHRLDRQAMRIARLLDGSRTLEQLWATLAADGHATTPSQEDILQMLGQLHALDLLDADTVPDLAELDRRDTKAQRRRFMARWLNPLAIRVPLVDPDRFLQAAVRWLAPVLNRWGALLWLALVLPAIPLAAARWGELTGNFAERMLAFDNLLLLALIFPVIKALHEIGHGIAVRMHGGEVHDMGVMLLVLLPVPYVEASSSWAFASKWDRALVGAAGMLVEIAIAAIAFYLWLWLEPGTARAVAYDVAVLASLTTLVFNANPLLRYDGYYVLSDLVEIPNLGQRATRWWGAFAERHLLRRRQAPLIAHSAGEAAWFAGYAPLAFVYRVFVMIGIALFVATEYPAVGVLLAVWALIMSFGLPLAKAARWIGEHLVGSGAGGPRRVILAAAALLFALLMLLPLPHRTHADGVLWLPDSGVLRATQAGRVQLALAQPGEVLRAGAPVMQLADADLEHRLQAASAREAAARARHEAARTEDAAAGEKYAAQWRHAQRELEDLQQRGAQLELRSEAAGQLWQARHVDLPGLQLKKGDVVGYVVPDAAPRVRVLIEQSDEDLIRRRTEAIDVRLPFDGSRAWPATVLRAVPAASNELPSAAFGQAGGGARVTDPRDDSGRRALTTHFEYELALPPELPYRVIGARVAVRFQHPAEPIGPRIWRGVRRLFLAQFDT